LNSLFIDLLPLPGNYLPTVPWYRTAWQALYLQKGSY
jgi:hypothetical protein